MFLAAGFPVRAANAPRLAAIDWAMLETAVAIGHMPVAAAELIRYRQDVGQPVIPGDITDLGLRGAPNFELLQLLRPDLILSSNYYTRYEARLAEIAPVFSLPFYLPGQAPLPHVMQALSLLAGRIGDPAAGAAARDAADATLDVLAARATGFRDRPVCLVNIGDARHMRVFGFDSLFGNVASRIGLRNAWAEGTKFSFLAPVPLEKLVDMPDARLVIAGEIPINARRSLSRSVLWRALPPVAAGRVYLVPEGNPFGGAPSALRFAQSLIDALERGPQVLA
ncbi:MAG: ABC transporter substrate-binding protein [Paracoccus sp. (in: a-proteobacteria)]|uniref:ABC transporter substrate-binding protein n=1 Tax=Paracoccus sp. TaxID=267 RepID=UPI0026E000D0|nr:ABC transporter substrate-binding protein [Paracoccus sp. (in: a-proteobacteria)]MDO5614456.1 ABC transporter substrate-binding protein [Paracoccus sp. (in: a-proteobacteria)]